MWPFYLAMLEINRHATLFELELRRFSAAVAFRRAQRELRDQVKAHAAR